jgi:GxxExxY protein
MLYSDATDQILKAFYKVYNFLGYGFLEKVYENALFKRIVFTNSFQKSA